MPYFGAIIIGDELLSGKRPDKHLPRLIESLGKRGLVLAYAHMLGDDPDRITDTLKQTFSTSDIVFIFGGIGATPDDYTRQSAAAALGVPVAEHPLAIAEMQAKPDYEVTANRRRMAEFPLGATIIPNPYNRIAAFSCGDHHFLPGFPEMAWPMIDWVLESNYAHLFHATILANEIIVIRDAGESNLIDMMDRIVARYPRIKLSSLPQFVPGGHLLELSLSGAPTEVPMAMAEAKAEITRLGFSFS